MILFSTENKSEDIFSENEVIEKTEPVFASSEEKIEENVSEDNNLSINEKEEFSAEETESSEIDDEFNQETEEELLDIPTFLEDRLISIKTIICNILKY